MNFNAVRLFLHVMQRGSLVAAANDLNMSPSSASRLLVGLERSTGLALFSRDRQRLQPTPEGERYYNECYRVLVAVDELPRVAERLASGVRARLGLVSTPRFASSLMIPAIGRFLRDNADVEIDLQIMLRREIEFPSVEHSFDIGVVALPMKNPALKMTRLFDMPVAAIMRRNHPLARREFLRATELAAQQLVLIPSGTRIRDESRISSPRKV